MFEAGLTAGLMIGLATGSLGGLLGGLWIMYRLLEKQKSEEVQCSEPD